MHKIGTYIQQRPQECFSRRGSKPAKEELVRGVAAWGVPGGRGPRTPEKISKKFVKKSMKNYNYLKIFKKISRFFENFFENFIEFLAKMWTKIRKCRNMHLQGVRGRSPRRQRIYGNLSRKINGNLQFLDSSNGNFAIFHNF